jgi:hypothetical protein
LKATAYCEKKNDSIPAMQYHLAKENRFYQEKQHTLSQHLSESQHHLTNDTALHLQSIKNLQLHIIVVDIEHQGFQEMFNYLLHIISQASLNLEYDGVRYIAFYDIF